MKRLDGVLALVGISAVAGGAMVINYSYSLSKAQKEELEKKKKKLEEYKDIKGKHFQGVKRCTDVKTCTEGLGEYKKEREETLEKIRSLRQEIENDESYLIPKEEWDRLSLDIQNLMVEMSWDYCEKENAKIISKSKKLFFGESLGTITIDYDACADENSNTKKLEDVKFVIIDRQETQS